MKYMVLTSSGAILETDSAAQYVAWLDEYGPEVVDQMEPVDAEQQRITNDAMLQQYAKPNPRTNVGSIFTKHDAAYHEQYELTHEGQSCPVCRPYEVLDAD